MRTIRKLESALGYHRFKLDFLAAKTDGHYFEGLPLSIRVAIVADEPLLSALYKIMLGQAGYESLEFRDATELVKAPQTTGIDVILLDQMLKEPGSLSAAKELKQNLVTKSSPIILVGVRRHILELFQELDGPPKFIDFPQGIQEINQATNSSIKYWLVRPFSSEELRERVEQVYLARS